MGYKNSPVSAQRQHLRLHIHASGQTDELRLGENEFNTLVNHLPMAIACSEARASAIKLFRARIEFMNLFCLIEDQVPDGK
jgi:hypothetical protein